MGLLGNKKEFWDLEEEIGYKRIKANDNLEYKVWDNDPSESWLVKKEWWTNQTQEQQQEVANLLANIRKDLNTLLIYLLKNEYLYMNNPIAFGIYHTFDLHIPCWRSLDLGNNVSNLIKLCNETPFIYQEMRPNGHGILGLNKPKKIITIKAEIDNNKIIDYELGTKRTILLTVRSASTGKMRPYQETLCLAIHELTHTTCNDVRWVPDYKGGNHRDPYPTYHKLMRKWARECGILNHICPDNY